MSPEWLIKNPVSPGTMMGPGMGYQNAEMWQAAVNGMNTMMGSQSYMSSYQAQALETVATPAGTFVNALHVREQRGTAYARDVWYAPDVGMVRWMDGQEEALLTRVRCPPGRCRRVASGRVSPCGARPLFHDRRRRGDCGPRCGPVSRLASEPEWPSMSFVPAADTGGMASPVCRYYGKSRLWPGHALLLGVGRRMREQSANWPEQWLLESSNVFQVPAGPGEWSMPGRNVGGLPHLEPAGRQ